MLCQNEGVSICPIHLDALICLDAPLYVWMPLVYLDVPICLGHPPYVWMPPVCLDAPCMFGCPTCLDTPICLDALHMFGCPHCMFGCCQMYGRIQRYEGHPNIWEVSKHIRASKHMRASKYMGHPNIWGHLNICGYHTKWVLPLVISILWTMLNLSFKLSSLYAVTVAKLSFLYQHN